MIASVSVAARDRRRGVLAGPAEDMGEVGRGLEMPAPAALDQLDAMAGVALGQRGQRRLDIAFADIGGDVLDAERRVGGEQRRFDRRGSTRPSGGVPDQQLGERLVLLDLEPALPRQLERRDEAARPAPSGDIADRR